MIKITCDDERVSKSLLAETAGLFAEDINYDLVINVKVDGSVVVASGGGIANTVVLTSPTASAKLAAYLLLSSLTGIKKPWGALTGVKPMKPFIKLLEEGYSGDEAEMRYRLEYAVSPDKIQLCWDTVTSQKKWLYPLENTYSLYVHIPFCPSKCTYCSFPSDITSEGSELCDAYLCALEKELDAIARFNLGKTCDCIYIGGGTPSVLSADQCEKLFTALRPFRATAFELTFEGGRCDTLDFDKLSLIKQLGASRISLNPQTVHNCTLETIKRPATYEDFAKCYCLAEAAGWDNINTDLIFGLPGENEAMFSESLKKITELNPASVTLHSLCKKRTSEMSAEQLKISHGDIASFMDMARGWLNFKGYHPYYLYRQKFAVSNAENTGYCRDGKVCVYNIRMMSECQSIYSAGANSTTKLYFPENDSFVNIYNVKNTDIYIRDIDKVIQKKLASVERALNRF